MTAPAKPSVLFAGIARNCEATLEETVRCLEAEISEGWDRRWLVIESYSFDGTIDVLTRLSRRQ